MVLKMKSKQKKKQKFFPLKKKKQIKIEKVGYNRGYNLPSWIKKM